MSLIVTSHLVLNNAANINNVTKLFGMHYNYLHLREYITKIDPLAVRLGVQSPSIFLASLFASFDIGKEVTDSVGFVHGFPGLLFDLFI